MRAVAGWVTPSLSRPLETFWTNPQFRLTLLEPDEEEDDDEEGPWGGWGAAGAWGPARGGRIPKCTVLLSLIQRNRRRLRAQGLTYLTVGFHVFQVGPQGLAEAAGDRRGGAGKAEGVEVRDRTEPRAWGWGVATGQHVGNMLNAAQGSTMGYLCTMKNYLSQDASRFPLGKH